MTMSHGEWAALDRRSKILELYKAGFSVEQIARGLDLTVTIVKRVVNSVSETRDKLVFDRSTQNGELK
jgi:DNA invertase Pin-like site-specific DNA recombinase